MTSSAEPVTGSAMSYVYAVGRADALLDTALVGGRGLESEPLRAVRAGGLVALASTVPYASYGADGMKAQLEDLGRLEVIARTHHAVVEAAYEHATVLPMRLSTVYLDDDRVRGMLGEREAEFSELLARLEGQVEFGVKVYADPREAATVSSPEPEPAAGPGRAYLQQRRAQRQSHRDAYRAAGVVAAEVPARVADIVRAHITHRPQQGDLAAGAGENLVNEAYLVPAARVVDFREALMRLGDDVPGVRVEITGPWAPYSFATPSSAAIGGPQ